MDELSVTFHRLHLASSDTSGGHPHERTHPDDPSTREVELALGHLPDVGLLACVRGCLGLGPHDRVPREVTTTELHDVFAELLDDGQDVAQELHVPHRSGDPEWIRDYGLGVLVKRLEHHPWFDDEGSRTIRRALGLGEVPDDLVRPGNTP